MDNFEEYENNNKKNNATDRPHPDLNVNTQDVIILGEYNSHDVNDAKTEVVQSAFDIVQQEDIISAPNKQERSSDPVQKYDQRETHEAIQVETVDEVENIFEEHPEAEKAENNDHMVKQAVNNEEVITVPEEHSDLDTLRANEKQIDESVITPAQPASIRNEDSYTASHVNNEHTAAHNDSIETDVSAAKQETISPQQHIEDTASMKEDNNSMKENHTSTQDTYYKEETNPTPPRKKKKNGSFLHRHRNGAVITACVLLSIGGGFGGTMLALRLNDGGTGKTVLYQGVDTGKNNTEATNTSASIKDIADETMNSVVEIKTESVSTHSYYSQAVVSGAGSGVILSKDGYIVTNNHVIEGANKITVTTKDGKSYEAKLIGTDSATDLAVLKIEAENLKPAVLGDSSKLAVGDTAVAIGNPLGSLGGTVTSGIISALDREVTIDNKKMNLLQTNAAINPGNSGGGLFNAKGELIGIVNAKSSGDSIEGLGFAIPINRAKDIITNLIENGYVKGRASLGVTLATGSDSPFNDGNTQVYIYKVEKGKAADKAGLESGDQILKIDGESISEMSDVTSIISSHKAGDKIKMTILRDDETKTITITLGEAANTSNTQDDQDNSSQRR